MPLKPTRSETLKTAMIASGKQKKTAYQAVAGRANQPGYRGPPDRAGTVSRPVGVVSLAATANVYAALNSVQMRSRSFVPSGETSFGSSFSSVAGAGKTSVFANTSGSMAGSITSRLSGEP